MNKIFLLVIVEIETNIQSLRKESLLDLKKKDFQDIFTKNNSKELIFFMGLVYNTIREAQIRLLAKKIIYYF